VIMSQMQVTGGAHARQNALYSHDILICLIVLRK
jgi:hypothetical protein